MSAAISSAALPPLKAIAQAVALLEAKGFAVRAVNDRGDAVYLRRDGHPLDLRVANHARSAKQRQRNRGIAASLVIDAPLTASRLAERVAAALRNYEAGVSDAAVSGAGASGARK